MTFVIQTSSYRLARRRSSHLREAVRAGLIGAGAAVYLSLIGIVPLMAPRFIVFDILPVGHLLMALAVAIAAYVPARHATGLPNALTIGAIAGGIVGIALALFVQFVLNVNIRSIVVTAGPPIVQVLSLGRPPQDTIWLLPIACAMLGALSGALARLGPAVSKALLVAALTVVAVALLKDVVVSLLANIPGWRRAGNTIYGLTGLRVLPAAVLFVAAFAVEFWRQSRAASRDITHTPGRSRMIGFVVLAVIALALPIVTNAFVAQVMIMACLYILMSAGLNIELGYAGLVDLGFVAFFAIGAYVVALFSSTSDLAFANWSFWLCLPLAVVAAAVGGFIFGLPVLRVRGDYLAMATLGLGEIVRVLVLSDALKPHLGASSGIGEVTRPEFAGIVLNTPTHLYYLGVILVVIVVIMSVRLKNSKIGRAWLALREDEDVAQALGIDPVAYKLIAYTTGAAFAGAAGAVFAVLVGGVYPHSFQLLVSTNVLAILIIGGLGSIPGVICGALALIAIPELLREFGEYRYLVYGLVLIAMMHFKPDGLWPASSVGRAGK